MILLNHVMFEESQQEIIKESFQILGGGGDWSLS